MRKSLLSKREIVGAYEGGLTIDQVAARAGISPRTVRIHLADCGAAMRRQGRPGPRDAASAAVDARIRMMRAERKTFAAIGAELGMNKTSVYRRLCRP